MKQNKFFKGGVKIPHYKNTKDSETEILPIPDLVEISMLHHIGAPCSPLVSVGENVKVGQIIGDSKAFMSAPIHSSVSGIVKKMSSRTFANGSKVATVIIETDKKQEVLETIKPPVITTKQDFIAAIRESGLVGLGGAGFPAHIKLNVPEGKTIDRLLINAAECEPYITSDYRETLENSWAIISGINIVKDYLGIDNVIIGVEDNKPIAIDVLTGIAKTNDKIDIMPLKSKYPQGAEKMLIYAMTGRKVPAGKLPLDVGVIVMNIASIAFISKFIKTGMPLVKRRLTIDGKAITNSKNLEVVVGTPIDNIIEYCGGIKGKLGKIIMGGPMMGVSQFDSTMPILKQNNAILFLNKAQSAIPEETSCIRCGKCIEACPMKLMPLELNTFALAKDEKQLKELNLLSCMECGSCSYVCPAKRHLVQSFRDGKNFLRAQGGKK